MESIFLVAMRYSGAIRFCFSARRVAYWYHDRNSLIYFDFAYRHNFSVLLAVRLFFAFLRQSAKSAAVYCRLLCMPAGSRHGHSRFHYSCGGIDPRADRQVTDEKN